MKKLSKRIYSKLKRCILQKIYQFKKYLNLKKISEISGLEIPKEYNKYKYRRISDVSLSVRDLKPNCIFFCLLYNKLRKEDVEKIRKNAFIVVTPKPIKGCKNIICQAPATYGMKMLNYIRNLSKAKVVAVTGSVGKTSTKEMVESVLMQKYSNQMVASIGNSNSSFKAGLNIKKLTANDKVYLQEVGAGSMAYDIVKRTAIIIEADVAIYTNIRDNHIEWYGSRENIAKEKFTLSDYGKKDGLAIINYDDEILRKHKFTQSVLSFSLNNNKADYYAKNILITSDGTSFTLVDTKENKNIAVQLKVIGEHHIINALVAYIVGKYLKISDKKIIKGLKKYKTTGARQNLINLGKYKVLADCYNSSYDALNSILKTFEIIKTKNDGKKLAVIGDIFELGKLSEKTHREVGILLAKFNLDKVYFIGNEMKYAFEEYNKIKSNAVYFDKRSALIKRIRSDIKENDLILFKASHGMHFASLIDSLFGTDIGEVSAINHSEFKHCKNNEFEYNVFDSHTTITKCLSKQQTIIIPEILENLPVEKLGKSIFKKNTKIKEITLSKNIVSLRGYCFKQSSLQKIVLNSNLKQIGPGTFNKCSNLKEIIIPEGVLLLGWKSFANCKNLKTVTIPNSVQKISKTAFLNSKHITIKCKKDSYAEEYAKMHNIKVLRY